MRSNYFLQTALFFLLLMAFFFLFPTEIHKPKEITVRAKEDLKEEILFREQQEGTVFSSEITESKEQSPEISEPREELKEVKSFQEQAPLQTIQQRSMDSQFPGISVVIDPGHGPQEANKGWNGILEGDLTFAIAQNLQQQLETAKIKVIMTREATTTPNIGDRVAVVQNSMGVLLVSIHSNAPGDGYDVSSIRGFVVYYAEGWEEDRAFAQQIAETYAKTTKLPTIEGGPVLPDSTSNPRLLGALYGGVPSVLIECGFHTNEQDARFLQEHPEIAAQGIAQGVLAQLEAMGLGSYEGRKEVLRQAAENHNIPAVLFWANTWQESNWIHIKENGNVNSHFVSEDWTDWGWTMIADKWHSEEVDLRKVKKNPVYAAQQGARILSSYYDGTDRENLDSWKPALLMYKGNGQAAQKAVDQVYSYINHPPLNPETGQPLWEPGERETITKLIALTFDAGAPRGEEMVALIEDLASQDIYFTVFVTGKWAEANPDLLKRLLTAGCEIGNHSYSHPYFSKLSNEQILWELEMWEKVTGIKSNLFRFPYGEIVPFGPENSRIVKLIEGVGYRVVGWDITTTDYLNPSPETIIQEVWEKRHDGGIAILHIGGLSTPEAVRQLIPQLQAERYSLVTVSELLKRKQVNN